MSQVHADRRRTGPSNAVPTRADKPTCGQRYFRRVLRGITSLCATLKKSIFVHRFVMAGASPKQSLVCHCSSSVLGWRGTMGQFSVGEVVTCIPHLICRSAAPGDYQIVGEMPVRDGDRMYRIKSPLEEHERVVGESLLVRSAGHLPDGAMAQRSRRGSITLPKLRIALRIDADDEPDGWSVVSVPGH